MNAFVLVRKKKNDGRSIPGGKKYLVGNYQSVIEKNIRHKKIRSIRLPISKTKRSAGIDVAALSSRAEKNQPRFLCQTCCRTAHNQALTVEQQRKHGRTSVNESHVSGGPSELAAGSTRTLPPLSKHIRYRSSRRVCGLGLLLLGTCEQEEHTHTQR